MKNTQNNYWRECMKSVPNIISTKDLSYLEDMLNWNFILIKKINNYH